MKHTPSKIVLAYSGGLDTSIIALWLQRHYDAEVITFTADLGQDGEELKVAKEKAERIGIRQAIVQDVRKEFVEDYIFPMLRANAVYEGRYQLGSAIARPIIAQKQIEWARKLGANTVAHGATGKGNDQIRFEYSYKALDPEINIISPWREWNLNSRTDLINYAQENNIPITTSHNDPRPYSIDANIFHTCYEGESLEDPATSVDGVLEAPITVPERAPAEPEFVRIGFSRGNPESLNGETLDPVSLMSRLNQLGQKHGTGYLDVVENRVIGTKTRGVYVTPGATILLIARRELESLTIDADAEHLKEDLMPRYARMVYSGRWFSLERMMLQAAMDHTQINVTGEVTVKLYKGAVRISSRSSPSHSLYNRALSSFESGGDFDRKIADGYVKTILMTAGRFADTSRRGNSEQSPPIRMGAGSSARLTGKTT